MFKTKKILRAERVTTRLAVVTWISLDSNNLYVRYIDTEDKTNVQAEVYYHSFTDADPTVAGLYFFVGQVVVVIIVENKKYVVFSIETALVSGGDVSGLLEKTIDGPGYENSVLLEPTEYNFCGDNWIDSFKNGFVPGTVSYGEVEDRIIHFSYNYSIQKLHVIYDEYQQEQESTLYVPYAQNLYCTLLRKWNVGSHTGPERRLIVPNSGSKFLSSSGWQWSTGTYRGLSFNTLVTRVTGTFGNLGQGGAVFPTERPIAKLMVSIADGFDVETSEYGLAAHPIYCNDIFESSAKSRVQYGTSTVVADLYTTIAKINMPWRRASESETYTPCPNLYVYPEELSGGSAKLHYGIVDQVDELYYPVEGVPAHRYPLNIVNGYVLMSVKPGAEGNLLDSGDYDYTHSYSVTEQRPEYTVKVLKVDDGEGGYTHRSTVNTQMIGDTVHRMWALSQQFTFLTDGVNKFKRVPYLFYDENLFSLEIDYIWNEKTVFTQTLYRHGIAESSEEFPFFRQFDTINGFIVVDVRVTDFTEKTVKWERRICYPGGLGIPATHYYTVWTYTPPTQPTGSVPDIRNIPPWLQDPGFDTDDLPFGISEIESSVWNDPFFADSWASFPGPSTCTYSRTHIETYPRQFANYFPGDNENICTCGMTMCALWNTNSHAVARWFPQPHVMATKYGWVANMPVCLDVDYDDVILHYNSTLLEKRNGVVSGIDVGSIDTIDTPARRYNQPKPEWDYPPEEEP